jgi:hypothetical protein
MSRSVDTPRQAGAWPADDLLLRQLRAARPEPPGEIASPHTRANQLMLERIMGGPPTDGRPNRLGRAPRSPRLVRRLLPGAAAVAAAAATVAGLVVVSPFGSTEPSAAAVVRDAAVASQEALDSGRAVLTVEREGYEEAYEYAFAGDDVGVEITLGPTSGGRYPGQRRIVDGELYWHVGDDPATPWFHQTGGVESRSDFGGDPRSLLASLEPNAGFEVVGDDTVDGVEVTRLHATTPENVRADELSLGEATVSNGTLTDLEVWIDSDDVLRRIDLTMTQTFDMRTGELSGPPGDGPVDIGSLDLESVTNVITASVQFTDIGVPNTIEVPQNVRDVSVEELANPAPPPAIG